MDSCGCFIRDQLSGILLICRKSCRSQVTTMFVWTTAQMDCINRHGSSGIVFSSKLNSILQGKFVFFSILNHCISTQEVISTRCNCACTIYNPQDLVSLCGALTSIPLTLILPAVLYRRLYPSKAVCLLLVASTVFMTVGLIGAVGSINVDKQMRAPFSCN